MSKPLSNIGRAHVYLGEQEEGAREGGCPMVLEVAA